MTIIDLFSVRKPRYKIIMFDFRRMVYNLDIIHGIQASSDRIMPRNCLIVTQKEFESYTW